MSGPKITVIIPVLNEQVSVSECLRQFERLDRGGSCASYCEIIVVDGGSSDRTWDIASEFSQAKVLLSKIPGRAAQMNAGAERASGDILLFLHTDTYLPQNAFDEIIDSINSDGTVGGRFRLRLSESGISYRLIGVMSTLRSKYLGITYGDQAIYVRKDVFQRVGGFPEIPIFEDSEFCKKLSRTGNFQMLHEQVTASARRWKKNGVWKTVLKMWLLKFLYSLEVPPEKLVKHYECVR